MSSETHRGRRGTLSGTGPVPAEGAIFGELVTVLEPFISKITVRSVLTRTLNEMHLEPSFLGGANVDQVVEKSMLGLRLFCPPEKLAELMLAVAEYCQQVHASGRR
jgi:hypothetical protein